MFPAEEFIGGGEDIPRNPWWVPSHPGGSAAWLMVFSSGLGVGADFQSYKVNMKTMQ